QPVSACRETIDERLRRLLRRHGRNFLLGLAFLLPVVALVIALVGERLKDRATWGSPVFQEDFAGPDLGPDLTVMRGAGEIRDGGFVTTDPQGTYLLCRQRFEGPTAIEYEGEHLPGSQLCDLSLLWSRSFRTDADGG